MMQEMDREFWANEAGLKIIVPWEEPAGGDKTLNELFGEYEFTYPAEWIEPYFGKNPNFGFDEVGWVVYVRTYSRETGGGGMETWTDTTRRVWEGNYNIRFPHGGFDRTATLRDACRAFHIAWHLGVIPPGRSLWMSGSEYMKTRGSGGSALNNCYGINVQPMALVNGGPSLVSTPFRYTMDQAMLGGGVGANIQREYVRNIPYVKNKVELFLACSSLHPNHKELEPDFTDEIPAYLVDEHTDVYVLEDSREGWVEALGRVIDAHWNGTKRVILDFTQIRPYGKKLTFGGKASGPGPLKAFRTINQIINDRYMEFDTLSQTYFKDARDYAWARSLRPIDCGDIIQIIGSIVVAGNIRRTALILVGDETDREFIESKNYEKVGWAPSAWRWTSNNSISIGPDTSYDHLRTSVAPDIYYNGEPGYVNLELSRNYGRLVDGYQQDVDKHVSIFNPCGEITLDGGHYDEETGLWYGGEPCNLFEISPYNLYLLGFDYEEACDIGARFAYRVTFAAHTWDMLKNVIEQNRRIGVALTGITDWALVAFNSNIVVGVDDDGNPQYCKPYKWTLDRMYKAVVLAGTDAAEANGENPPIKYTTVKPSGSVSLVLGNSPGQHFHWANYMFRRVTAGVDSPVVNAALEAGYRVEPKILGRDAEGFPNYDHKTAVIEFVTKAPTAKHPLFRNASEVPLWEQAMVQESLSTYWADNAVSATLNFTKAPAGDAEGEAAVLDEIARVLDRAKTRIKSTSLLPYFTGKAEDGTPYDQLPYEAISKELYLERKGKLKGKIQDFFNGSVQDEDLDSSFECQGGACPIR